MTEEITTIRSRALTGADHARHTEASDAGLAPGEWPAFIATDTNPTAVYDRGPGSYDSDGDLLSITYTDTITGDTITIFND